jgi:PleD family two-component response regulator
MGTESEERVLQRADAALYQAKRNGRDRIAAAA